MSTRLRELHIKTGAKCKTQEKGLVCVSVLTELNCSHTGQFLSVITSLRHAHKYLSVSTIHTSLGLFLTALCTQVY